MTQVWAQAVARPGVLLAVGPEGEGSTFDGANLVLGVAEVTGTAWSVRYRTVQRFCFPANQAGPHETADDVIPGSTILLFECGSGGSGGGSNVFVLGAPPGQDPGLILAVDCGETRFATEPGRVVVRSATLAMGSDNPPQPQPDVVFDWDAAAGNFIPEQQLTFCQRST